MDRRGRKKKKKKRRGGLDDIIKGENKESVTSGLKYLINLVIEQ